MITKSQTSLLRKYVKSLKVRAAAGDMEAVRALGAMVLLKASLEK